MPSFLLHRYLSLFLEYFKPANFTERSIEAITASKFEEYGKNFSSMPTS
jgi:hypothetical protein